MKKIIPLVLITICASSFAQVQNPIEHTKKIVSTRDVDEYIALNQTACGESGFNAIIEKYESLDNFKKLLKKHLDQEPPFDANTFWVTDDFKKAYEKESFTDNLFKGKTLIAGYKIVIYGDKTTSGFMLYQQQDGKWFLKEYPSMGKGLFVEE
jgi:hypothetical protein